MDILDANNSGDRHIFVFDNARTHLKRPDDALAVLS
jgi:hypothetical protein